MIFVLLQKLYLMGTNLLIYKENKRGIPYLNFVRFEFRELKKEDYNVGRIDGKKLFAHTCRDKDG